MNKELLAKAFNEANAHDVMRHADGKERFTMLSDMMMQYGIKEKADFAREDVDKYIREQYSILDDLISDFKYQERMMR
ncbi:MAG: hypothetical protein RR313_02395 [Anaerovoracaceae bacterium]